MNVINMDISHRIQYIFILMIVVISGSLSLTSCETQEYSPIERAHRFTKADDNDGDSVQSTGILLDMESDEMEVEIEDIYFGVDEWGEEEG